MVPSGQLVLTDLLVQIRCQVTLDSHQSTRTSVLISTAEILLTPTNQATVATAMGTLQEEGEAAAEEIKEETTTGYTGNLLHLATGPVYPTMSIRNQR
jgi:hypothetical protein